VADAGNPGELWGIFSKLADLNIFERRPGDVYDADFADLYDWLVDDYAGDLAMFEKHLVPGARVLDLACGSGRIGIPLARRGYSVDGLDLSRDMLARAEAKAAREGEEVRARLSFGHGDMSDFALPNRYDLILIAITSISLLPSADARAGLFRCARAHLASGGRLIFDFLDLSDERWHAMHNAYDVVSREGDDGVDFAITGQRFFPERRQFTYNIYREIVGWDGETKRALASSVKTWLDADELESELGAAGFRVAERHELNGIIFFVAEAEAAQ
jgi:ubiquinone/menaquinone biosynthesis C-methylase UbiE